MPTITNLEQQKRNNDRVSVFLDGEFAFGLKASLAAGLRAGQEIQVEEIRSLQERDALERGKSVAFSLLSYRPRSVAEIRDRLSEKDFSSGTIDQVVNRLCELDLLNDLEFARYWVEQRETFRPRSIRALKHELYQKGIGREIIDRAVAHVDERAAAQKVGHKQAWRYRGLPKIEFDQKLGRYLGNRGFEYSVVREVVAELWETREENRTT